jgi:hypothetical protein
MPSITLPRISSYLYSGNYGAHALRTDFGPLSVWFSYQTPIAFQVGGQPRVVRQNDWRQTTGKHLNAIDGGGRDARKERVTGETFEKLWAKQAAPLLSAE